MSSAFWSIFKRICAAAHICQVRPDASSFQRPGNRGNSGPWASPTIRDRVVQGAVKILLEPIFEAQFWHVSYGFRPGRNAHGALEYIRRATLPQKRDKDTRRNRLPYPWVIEGDFKGCFDNINHHHLPEQMRKRIGDRRVVRLVGLFLRAGVLTEDQFLRTDAGILGRRPGIGVAQALILDVTHLGGRLPWSSLRSAAEQLLRQATLFHTQLLAKLTSSVRPRLCVSKRALFATGAI